MLYSFAPKAIQKLIQSYIAFFTILYNSAHTKHTLKPADKGRRKATSTGHSSDQYYYASVTSTGSRADQYYSDRRPVLVTFHPSQRCIHTHAT